jgi:hypothetical protein
MSEIPKKAIQWYYLYSPLATSATVAARSTNIRHFIAMMRELLSH